MINKAFTSDIHKQIGARLKLLKAPVVDTASSNGGVTAPGVEIPEIDLQKQITRVYWSYGEDETEIASISRHYADLNLHVKTIGYEVGEAVNIDIKVGEELHNFSAEVQANEIATILNVFENKSLILEED